MQIRLSDFSVGLWNTDGVDLTAPPNALVTADNIEYLPNGSIRGRRGRVKYNSVALPGSVLSLHRHYPRTGTPSLLAAFVNGSTVEIRHDTVGNGTFSTLSGGTGFAANKRWRFVTWPEKGATFLVNGSDNMRVYDGSTLTNMGTSPRKGPYITLWQDQLFATDPNELNYSLYASRPEDETDWPLNRHISVSEGIGGNITGLSPHPDAIIILKEGGLWRFTGQNAFRYSTIGCIAPDTVQLTPWGTVFLSKSGLYVTDGQGEMPIELSLPIRPLFSSRSTETLYSNAIGIYQPMFDRYIIKFDPINSFVYVVQRLPGNKFAWARFTSFPMNCATTLEAGTDDGRLLIGDTTGIIWRAGTGNLDDTSPFTSVIKTASFLHQDDAIAATGRLTVMYRGSVPLSYVIEYDQNSAKQVSGSIGSSQSVGIQYKRTNITDLTKFGRSTAIQLSNPSDAFDFELLFAELDMRTHGLENWKW
jgi:hypothetical protein